MHPPPSSAVQPPGALRTGFQDGARTLFKLRIPRHPLPHARAPRDSGSGGDKVKPLSSDCTLHFGPPTHSVIQRSSTAERACMDCMPITHRASQQYLQTLALGPRVGSPVAAASPSAFLPSSVPLRLPASHQLMPPHPRADSINMIASAAAPPRKHSIMAALLRQPQTHAARPSPVARVPPCFKSVTTPD